MAVPEFYGEEEEDVYWWILCLEKFFKKHETPKSLKVLKAVGALKGSAFTWWIWWSRVHRKYNWDTLTTALLWRFKPEWRPILPLDDEEEEPHEELQPVHTEQEEDESVQSPNFLNSLQHSSLTLSTPFVTNSSPKPIYFEAKQQDLDNPILLINKGNSSLELPLEMLANQPPVPPPPLKPPLKPHNRFISPPSRKQIGIPSYLSPPPKPPPLNSFSMEITKSISNHISLSGNFYIDYLSSQAYPEIFMFHILLQAAMMPTNLIYFSPLDRNLSWKSISQPLSESTIRVTNSHPTTMCHVFCSKYFIPPQYSMFVSPRLTSANASQSLLCCYMFISEHFISQEMSIHGIQLLMKRNIPPFPFVIFIEPLNYYVRIINYESLCYASVELQEHFLLFLENFERNRHKWFLRAMCYTFLIGIFFATTTFFTATTFFLAIGFAGVLTTFVGFTLDFEKATCGLLEVSVTTFQNMIYGEREDVAFFDKETEPQVSEAVAFIESQHSTEETDIEMDFAFEVSVEIECGSEKGVKIDANCFELLFDLCDKSKFVEDCLAAVERKVNVQLDRQPVFASNWNKAWLRVRGKSKGTKWYLDDSHRTGIGIEFCESVTNVLTRNEASKLYIVASTHNGFSYKVCVIVLNFTNASGITFMEAASLDNSYDGLINYYGHKFYHGLINYCGLIGSVSSEFLIGDIVFYGYAQEILIGINSTLIMLFQSNTVKDAFFRMMCGFQRIEMFCYQEVIALLLTNVVEHFLNKFLQYAFGYTISHGLLFVWRSFQKGASLCLITINVPVAFFDGKCSLYFKFWDPYRWFTCASYNLQEKFFLVEWSTNKILEPLEVNFGENSISSFYYKQWDPGVFLVQQLFFTTLRTRLFLKG